MADILFKRSLVHAAFLSNNRQAAEAVFNPFEEFQELTLPYTAKSSKIYNKDAEEFAKKEAKKIKEENSQWLNFIAAKKKENKK
jgi:hypothetical protein